MGQIGEILMAAGILAITAIFGIKATDPIHEITRVPVCSVSCEVFNAEVHCTSKTELVWSDFTQRTVDAGGYCGPCGSPAKCPKIKQFDEYKEENK